MACLPSFTSDDDNDDEGDDDDYSGDDTYRNISIPSRL